MEELQNVWGLTEIERKVLLYIMTGHPKEGIAEILNLSVSEVQAYTESICKKSSAISRPMLAIYALDRKVVAYEELQEIGFVNPNTYRTRSQNRQNQVV